MCCLLSILLHPATLSKPETDLVQTFLPSFLPIFSDFRLWILLPFPSVLRCSPSPQIMDPKEKDELLRRLQERGRSGALVPFLDLDLDWIPHGHSFSFFN